MEKEYSISESEWEVMKVLWKNPNSTMSFIVEQLEGRGWSYSTIKTLVKRLTDKEFVVADKSQGKNFLESNLSKKEEEELMNIINKMEEDD